MRQIAPGVSELVTVLTEIHVCAIPWREGAWRSTGIIIRLLPKQLAQRGTSIGTAVAITVEHHQVALLKIDAG